MFLCPGCNRVDPDPEQIERHMAECPWLQAELERIRLFKEAEEQEQEGTING